MKKKAIQGPTASEMDAIRRDALEFAGIGLCRFTFDGTILLMDRGALKIYDLERQYPDPALLIGKNIENLFTYTMPRGLLRGELKKHRRVLGFEYRFRTLSGIDKCVLHDSYLVQDPRVREEVIQVIMVDISDRKRAEEQLDHVLRGARCILWHAIVDERGDGNLRWDIHVSNEPAAEQLLPLRREAGQSYSEVWHEWTLPQDRARIDRDAGVVLRTGQTGYTQEFRVRRADGEIRWLHEDARIEPLGPARWLVVGICTDVTERKRAEEDLRRSEERFRQVAETAREWIWEVDDRTLYTYASPVVEQILGYRPEEIVGKKHIYDLIHPDDKRKLRKRALRIFLDKKPFHEMVARHISKNGQPRWLSSSAVPILDAAGALAGYRGAYVDVTERLAAEKHQQTISDGLRAVVAIADELIAAPDPDQFFRRAVELAREKLGLERCAVFIQEGNDLRGTYGTDRQGQTTDEKLHRFPTRREWLERFRTLSPADRRTIVLDEAYVEAAGGRAVHFGAGWIAITPIQSGGQLLGVFSNDSAITGGSIDPTQQEIVSVYCSVLGTILERIRTEGHHKSLSEGLRAIVGIADDLISCPDLDTIYLHTVELARRKLGIERCAVFVGQGPQVKGTYGTDRLGRTTDEHAHYFAADPMWLERLRLLRQQEQRMMVVEQPYHEWKGDRTEMFGHGWVAITPIVSGTEFLGLFCNDTAITGAPMDPMRQELVSILCSLVGAILLRAKAEARHRDISVRLRTVLGLADVLIACRDLDTLYRRAVELARTHLGAERCAIFLLRDGAFRGTYGTNCRGETTDEHQHLFEAYNQWLERFRTARPEDRQMVLVEEPYTEWEGGHARRFDHGWVAITPIQSSSRFIGVFSNDSALSRGPVDEVLQEVIAVFCSLLGAIIDRKHAEEEIQRLAMVVEQEAEAVVISDTSGTIQYVNPSFERITGYPRQEVLGKNPRLLKSGRQDAAYYQRMWARLTSGHSWSGHFTNRRKDGSLYETEATISPIRDVSGSIVNYVATSRDVTREMQLEEQFRRAQKMEAIGRLAGGIAHDFNNLLTSILGYGRMIRESLGDGHPLTNDLEEIIRAGDRAAALTKQLLAFSRKQLIEAQPLNLNAVVADMDKLLRRTLGEDVELVSVFGSEAVHVKADAGLLEQVIMNLALNARDAMPKGGKLTIQTAVVDAADDAVQRHAEAEPGDYAQILVRDTGVGMSKEVLEHCFEPFFTTKDVGKGTGLGLAIVYSIVKQFKGFIEINTAPASGTEIRLYLPRTEAAAAKPPSREEIALPHGTETILVVEDEETVRRLTVRLLESLGYHVLEARHGGEALLICERHKDPIHLVLTDVVMPHLGGQELVDRLHQIRDDFGVLYMSGFTDDAFARHGVSGDTTPMLLKPFTHEALAVRIRQVLDKR